ncbi:Shedu anti-phage system protein SduA domain-containing protein [Tissierella sp.]|uniref:Shedu anti-phage system protein SduA domain-containing protein n=1 Tax=Tissierella sp. TaxID=41274 RepID=UPI00285CAD30|nr:Shedu anti-phage system protein SduA domain-containing protein [Tissierella sp.]MDR7856054.1 DUF4263 domain-containing protein [Tissierella sp.]
MDNKEIYENLAFQLLSSLSKVYWQKMYSYIKENNINHKDVNCFLLNPESMVIYFGQKFIAIEYCGNPYKTSFETVFQYEVMVRDFTREKLTTKQFIEKIIGFRYDGTSDFSIPLFSDIYEDLIIPTNAGMDKLIDLKWNFTAQSSVMSLNSTGLDITDNHFVRLINCRFFDEQKGDLKTRIIKWIDFLPYYYNEPDEGEFDEMIINLDIYDRLWYQDIFYEYPKPNDFKFSKLPQINRFIEFFGDSNYSEPEITSFLARDENKFILNMGFMGTGIYDEVLCEWQSEKKDNIKPDFFILRANGYADIIEFKLPRMKSKLIVGKNNREHFNSELNTYIAQTRVYATYFDDPNNRKWFEDRYGFKVYKPKRYLVIGRRNDFQSDEWIEIKADYNNLEIITYDDLVDTVISQFYQ